MGLRRRVGNSYLCGYQFRIFGSRRCESLVETTVMGRVLVNSQLTPALLLHMTYSNRLVWPQQWHYHTQTRCADGQLLLHIIYTRQLTVNTCLVNAYDVLKPPCMAAALAYSMRRRPIVVAYIQCGLLIRARGC